MPRPGRFTSGNEPVPIVQEAEKAPRPETVVQSIPNPANFVETQFHTREGTAQSV